MPDNESPEMQRLQHVANQLELEIEELRHMKKIVPFLEKFEADLIAIREKLFTTRLDILAKHAKNVDWDGAMTPEPTGACRAPRHGEQVLFRKALEFCRIL